MYDEKPVVQLVESYLRDHLSIETVCFVLMLCDLFSLSNALKLGKSVTRVKSVKKVSLNPIESKSQIISEASKCQKCHIPRAFKYGTSKTVTNVH